MKAVIFDMDGVIIDSEPLWQIAEREVFSSLGVNVDDKFCEITKTMTTTEVTKFWYNKSPWQNWNLQEVEQMVVSRVADLIEKRECEISGVKELVKRLKSKGFKLGLATNSPVVIIPVVLRKVGVSDLFDAISSAESEENGKPDPAIYLRTSEKLNVSPQNCIVIEDSYSGMLAAKRAGMTVVAFTNGHKEVNLSNADYTIESFGNFDLEIFDEANVTNEF
jgi:mannitol-1-/sugar-/sorbitol-6-/2-deoxyglucose-6-phosphatase